MRRLYLHATNEFTLNPIQTGGGFGSHPPPYQAQANWGHYEIKDIYVQQ